MFDVYDRVGLASTVQFLRETRGWQVHPNHREKNLPFPPRVMFEACMDLFTWPTMISAGGVAAAEILFDSWGVIGPFPQNETDPAPEGYCAGDLTVENILEKSKQWPNFPGLTELTHIRSVGRNMIAKNPRYAPMKQLCQVWSTTPIPPDKEDVVRTDAALREPQPVQTLIVMWISMVSSYLEIDDSIHPPHRGVMIKYDLKPGWGGCEDLAEMTMYFLPISSLDPSLSFYDLHSATAHGTRASYWDAIIARARSTNPQVDYGINWRLLFINSQDYRQPFKPFIGDKGLALTLERLTKTYKADQLPDWPKEIPFEADCKKSIHVAAYLIEAWRDMYGVNPVSEDPRSANMALFPGFVDITCGSGMLVYILLMEGYAGWGYDAKSRKSWKAFPRRVQERLLERAYIPKPFADVTDMENLGMETYTENFPRDTFIISLHSDEMTLWTPVLAALCCPESPLPFLVIPCCPCLMSGLPCREDTPQPATGDLKALRAERMRDDARRTNSDYGTLVTQTIDIAYSIGYDVEDVHIEIPGSRRDRGIFGNRLSVTRERCAKVHGRSPPVVEPPVAGPKTREVLEMIDRIVNRGCEESGSIEAAAHIWIECMRSIHNQNEEDHRLWISDEFQKVMNLPK